MKQAGEIIWLPREEDKETHGKVEGMKANAWGGGGGNPPTLQRPPSPSPPLPLPPPPPPSPPPPDRKAKEDPINSLTGKLSAPFSEVIRGMP